MTYAHNEAASIELLDQVITTCRERERDAVIATDATIHDLAPPLQQNRSRDDVAAWLEGSRTAVEQDFTDLRVHVVGDVLFLKSVMRGRRLQTQAWRTER